MTAPLFYIINTLLTIFLYVVILRGWMQYTQVNYYNPLTQAIIKYTQPIVAPLRKVLPSIGRVDTATLVIVYVVALLKFIFLISFTPNDHTVNPLYLLYAVLVIVYSLGSLIFWMLVARAILSWVSRSYSPIEEILSQLTEPFIAPIRRIIPPIGNIDLSFMIFVFILMIANIIAMNLFGDVWLTISQ